ncbi:MAG: hypothetical protein ACI97A_000517 [Planctomycetota bacterium]|jgi:hypothetical protein
MKLASVAVMCCTLMGLLAAGLNAQSPNVIVGDLNGVSNYSVDAGAGIDAFSVGTTSCNIGDANLSWQQNNNLHPVIGQHAFRLKDGRFEQIGQSWLKHGFFALSGTLCDGCPVSSDGTYLGIGCSDPYGSGLNGSQGGLGPKFQVNAFDGVYPYPYFGQGTTGNSTFKRLQVHTSDLDPAQNAGALYFVEGQYVTQDEAQAGNGADSVSWRQVNVAQSGADYNMSFTPGESTVRQEAAIQAWPLHDPAVNLNPIDVPGEGRFWVGFRSAPKPGGGYSFDVSIQNVTSDRCANGFEMEFPAGANISNISFHDVDYHSGEPFAGTDWVSTVDNINSKIRWDGPDFATTPMGNALRWGNLFSFHFESDLPASTIFAATMDLFKPGTPNDLQFNLAPKGGLFAIAGAYQGGNVFEDFAQLAEVQVIDGFGSPVIGGAVRWTVVSGNAFLPGSSNTITDANGRARHLVRGASSPGTTVIKAERVGTTESTEITVYTRRLRTFWTPANGTLLFITETERPGMFLTLAYDAPQVPFPTPWGNIHTSILNPSFDFGAVSSTGLIGEYEPSLVTAANGDNIISFGGNEALDGAGFTAVFQMISYYTDELGVGNYYISNPNFIFF